MPKQLPIDPGQTYSADKVRFTDIPVHAYKGDLAAEIARWGKDGLRAALRHMLVVREFESMLHAFKSTGAYRGIEYVYKGPAHLSVGQEAAAVGSAMALGPADQIFGSHRSHGEIIAKGLGAVGAMTPGEVASIVESHSDGRLLELVTRHVGEAGGDPAEAFLLTGVLAEIFMRDAGFNRGMGGSMHAFFTPFGAYPNNAIVGGSAGIAVGAATYGFFMLCEGFMVIKDDIPPWFIWGHYIGFHTYSFRPFMVNEFEPIKHFNSPVGLLLRRKRYVAVAKRLAVLFCL